MRDSFLAEEIFFAFFAASSGVMTAKAMAFDSGLPVVGRRGVTPRRAGAVDVEVSGLEVFFSLRCPDMLDKSVKTVRTLARWVCAVAGSFASFWLGTFSIPTLRT